LTLIPQIATSYEGEIDGSVEQKLPLFDWEDDEESFTDVSQLPVETLSI
jgi:hypothetical protein